MPGRSAALRWGDRALWATDTQSARNMLPAKAAGTARLRLHVAPHEADQLITVKQCMCLPGPPEPLRCGRPRSACCPSSAKDGALSSASRSGPDASGSRADRDASINEARSSSRTFLAMPE